MLGLNPLLSAVSAVLLSTALLAGCLGGPQDTVTSEPVDGTLLPAVNDVQAILDASLKLSGAPMVFTESVVDAAVSVAEDLYEPTMEVSDAGVIYVTGHTAGVDSTGAPVYMSRDDGQSWSQLPFFQSLTMPNPLPGATPPITDEIFLVAGDNGWLYGVDISLATFPVNAWSGNGSAHAYFNPNAYDEAQVALQAGDCVPAPAKDRPWGAYANGMLLMVSNPAAGPAQIGVMEVPPGLDTGPYREPLPVGVGATAGGGWWNLCAGPGTKSVDCSIPGIPDLRADGLFAVPQRCEGQLYLILGNTIDIMDVEIKKVFAHTTSYEITSVYGQAAFDKSGTLFVGITNNTAPDKSGNRTGQLHVAVSADGGGTFADRTFITGLGAPVRHFYMDANKFGPGALMVWAVNGSKVDDAGNAIAFDWYAGHLQRGADGLPILENAYLILDEGPMPSAHVTGAAVGPDGRAYTAMFEPAPTAGDLPVGLSAGTTPISVWIQREGPTLPVQ